MPDTHIYHYQPTLNGFRYTSACADDPLRQVPAVLYPDNRRERIFDAETLKQIERYPFRPVVCAMTAPRYRLDLHSVAGTAGEGRFAVVRGMRSAGWMNLPISKPNIIMARCATQPKMSALAPPPSESPSSQDVARQAWSCGLMLVIPPQEPRYGPRRLPADHGYYPAHAVPRRKPAGDLPLRGRRGGGTSFVQPRRYWRYVVQ